MIKQKPCSRAYAYLWEEVFICEMHSSFLWSRANFIAVFNETSILLIAISMKLPLCQSMDLPRRTVFSSFALLASVRGS